jgi:23S rRNA pseudouridine1911/1915/1917 synthase
LSWTGVRKVIAARRVRVDADICLDPARRLREGTVVTLLPAPEPLARAAREPLSLRFWDDQVVVVEKPAGLSTVRHPAERDWRQSRRELDPTLEDRVQWALGAKLQRPAQKLPRLRIVQRLDKATSGLVVFARSALAERELGRQFRDHSVTRKYLALVPGYLPPQTIRSRLTRDRGDGRRGSTILPGVGKEAVTHFDVVERFQGFTLLACRLETGRTHQIRIHLAEAGHPVCGEPVYTRRLEGTDIVDASQAERLCLHAAELGFVHPVTGATMRWEMPLPDDFRQILQRLRAASNG